MQDDERCCGTGTCIIDAAGRCWCGQQWNGERMCLPESGIADAATAPASTASTANPAHAPTALGEARQADAA